jgi:hypothetical protein
MRKKLLIGMSVFALSSVTACSSQELVYEKKRQPKSQVEEKIEDKLEAANPKKDLEVSITFEDEKKKKKKRKH